MARNPDLRHEALTVSSLITQARLLITSGEQNSDEAKRIRNRARRLSPQTSKKLRQHLGDLIVEGSSALDNGFKKKLFTLLFDTRSTDKLLSLSARAAAILGTVPGDYSVLELVRQIKRIEQSLAAGEIRGTGEVFDLIRQAEKYLNSPAGQYTGRFKEEKRRHQKDGKVQIRTRRRPIFSAEILTEARAKLELDVETMRQHHLNKELAGEIIAHAGLVQGLDESREETAIAERKCAAWATMDEARLFLPEVIRIIPVVEGYERDARDRLWRWEACMKKLREAKRRREDTSQLEGMEQDLQEEFITSAREWRRHWAHLAWLELRTRSLEHSITELCSLTERGRELVAMTKVKYSVPVEEPVLDDSFETKSRLAREYREAAKDRRATGRISQAQWLERIADRYTATEEESDGE